MQTTLAQTILKGMPLIIGIFLTIFLPFLLHGRTHSIAKKESLIKNGDDEKTLEYLLKWRDLLIAAPTGLFVLQFAAAGQLTSSCHKLFFIPLPEDLPLSDVALLVVFITPVFLLFCWFLVERLELRQAQIKRSYLPIFFFSVILWYLLSFLFVYSPDCPKF